MATDSRTFFNGPRQPRHLGGEPLTLTTQPQHLPTLATYQGSHPDVLLARLAQPSLQRNQGTLPVFEDGTRVLR